MITVNTHEAKSKLSALIRRVEKGQWVRICRDGTPIADLRPITHNADPLGQLDELRGVVFNEDPTAPLSEDAWPEDQQ